MPNQPPNMLVTANILAIGGAHSNGFPLAGPASASEEEIIYAGVNLSDARRKRVLNSFNQPLRECRINVYDEMLGARMRRGWY